MAQKDSRQLGVRGVGRPRELVTFIKVRAEAYTPTKGSTGAAGYDLYSIEHYTILAGKRKLISTGLQFQLPEGCYMRIAPRSSLAYHDYIHVGGGVVDADFIGEVKVILYNLGSVDFEINKGDRIAQFLLERIYYADLREIVKLPKLSPPRDEGARGTGSFGSTGK